MAANEQKINSSGTVKGRIQELIGNVKSCATMEGVSELEKLYKDKQKALGDSITPMMDIMVRDAISGRKEELKKADEEGKKAKTDEKAKSDELARVKMLDEVTVDLYNCPEQYLVEATEPDDEIVEAVVIFARMNPPTVAHLQMIKEAQELAVKRGAIFEVYLSHTQDPVLNPLTYDEKVSYLTEQAQGINFGDPKVINIFGMFEHLAHRGVQNVIMLAGADRLDECQRAAKYFTQKGGNHVSIVNFGDRSTNTISATRMRHFVHEGDFVQFVEMAGVDALAAQELYEQVERGMGI